LKGAKKEKNNSSSFQIIREKRLPFCFFKDCPIMEKLWDFIQETLLPKWGAIY
jgi:hypothetical protein